jgi:alkylation response protein AidB-like acyl-CoA dehydrogenase
MAAPTRAKHGAKRRRLDRRERNAARRSRPSRALCDARVLPIFEGAAEIQARAIARRLLEGEN